MKKYSWMIWTAALLAFSGYQGWTNRDSYLDDAYITLRYGQNLAAGKGWVYNPGQMVNASTSPLNTLLAAFACRASKSHAEYVMHFFDEVFLAISWMLVMLLFVRQKKYLPAIIGPLCIICDPLLHTVYGLETPLVVMLSLLSLVIYLRNGKWLGISLGLLILARPDGVVLACLILLIKAIKDKKIPFRDMARTFIMVLPWLIFSAAYFHSILPNTLAAKVAQKRSGYWNEVPFAKAVLVFFKDRYESFAQRIIIAIFIALGLYESGRRFRPAMILVLSALFLVIGYTLLGVPIYEWYFAPVVLAINLLLPLGVDAAWSAVKFKSKPRARVFNAFSLALILGLLYPHWRLIRDSTWLKMPGREQAYITAGKWIAENTAPHKSLLAVEIGALGYYSQRKIIEPAGLLASKEVMQELRQGRFHRLLKDNPPDLVLIHQLTWPMEEDVVRELPNDYKLTKRFDTPYYNFGNLLLLQK